MSQPDAPEKSSPQANREKLMTALFVSMVQQQAESALMMLGHLPHPETGEPVFDLETARLMIEQLSMLAVKTRGNLTADEDRMLKQCLHTVQMAFVKATKQSPGGAAAPLITPSSAPLAPTMAPASNPFTTSAPTAKTATPAVEPEEDSSTRKRFVKKYDA